MRIKELAGLADDGSIDLDIEENEGFTRLTYYRYIVQWVVPVG